MFTSHNKALYVILLIASLCGTATVQAKHQSSGSSVQTVKPNKHNNPYHHNTRIRTTPPAHAPRPGDVRNPVILNNPNGGSGSTSWLLWLLLPLLLISRRK